MHLSTASVSVTGCRCTEGKIGCCELGSCWTWFASGMHCTSILWAAKTKNKLVLSITFDNCQVCLLDQRGFLFYRIYFSLQLSEDREIKPEPEPSLTLDSAVFQNHSSHTIAVSSSPTIAMSRTSSNINSNCTNTTFGSVHATANNQKLGPPYSIVNIDSSLGLSTQASRRVCETYDDPKDISYDHDENKYQRKSAIEWILRWWKLIPAKAPVRRRTAGSLYKRYAILTVIGILFFVGIILLFSWLGRMATDGDPSFDLIANPNVKFGQDSN